MPRLLAVAALLAATLACTPVTVVEARITLTSELQASLTYPVQVAFETDVHVGQSHTLCDARAEDWLVVLEDESNECAEEMFVRAVLGPWTAPMTGCVEGVGNSFTAVEETAVAIANGIAFEDFDDGSGRCQGGDDSVDLVMSAVE
jgi:hypothetical protein